MVIINSCLWFIKDTYNRLLKFPQYINKVLENLIEIIQRIYIDTLGRVAGGAGEPKTTMGVH